jgi:hypothetical protein
MAAHATRMRARRSAILSLPHFEEMQATQNKNIRLYNNIYVHNK